MDQDIVQGLTNLVDQWFLFLAIDYLVDESYLLRFFFQLSVNGGSNNDSLIIVAQSFVAWRQL
jgi:hypothetical protein